MCVCIYIYIHTHTYIKGGLMKEMPISDIGTFGPLVCLCISFYVPSYNNQKKKNPLFLIFVPSSLGQPFFFLSKTRLEM